MKRKTTPYTFALIATVGLLAACGDKAPVQSSVVAGASDVSGSAPAAQILNTLTTGDGAVQLRVPVPQANNAKVELEGVAQSEIVFSHRDEADDLTIYAVKSGEPKQDAATFFTQLSQTIKTANLPETQVYPVQDNRLIYRFSRQEQGETLNEACAVIYQPAQIHTVCTTSPSLSLSELEATLRQLDPQSTAQPAAASAAGQ